MLDEAIAKENPSSMLSLIGSSDQKTLLCPIKFEGSDPLGSRIVSQDEDGAKILNRFGDGCEIPDSVLSNALT